MSVEENIAVVERFHELARIGDIEGAVACYALDGVNNGTLAHDTAARIFRNVYRLQRSHTIDAIFGVGDMVILRTTFHGAHTETLDYPIMGGMLTDLPPTGREFTAQQLHIYQVADGKIINHWGMRDDLGMLRQLGFTFAPPAGGDT